jgi:hypothetical protein
VDINVISREEDNTVKVDIMRNYKTPNERIFPAAVYLFPKGTTGVCCVAFYFSLTHVVGVLEEKFVPYVPLNQRKDIVVSDEIMDVL